MRNSRAGKSQATAVERSDVTDDVIDVVIGSADCKSREEQMRSRLIGYERLIAGGATNDQVNPLA